MLTFFCLNSNEFTVWEVVADSYNIKDVPVSVVFLKVYTYSGNIRLDIRENLKILLGVKSSFDEIG